VNPAPPPAAGPAPLPPWVALKFGGTSVATAENWGVIAGRVRELLAEHRVWVVASALTGVTNKLEGAIREAISGEPADAFQWIRKTHESLAKDIGIDEAGFAPVAGLLDELRRLLDGIRLTREASPRLRARVLSFGELASTWLGTAALRHHGLPCKRVDARELLRSKPRPNEPDEDRYLEAEIDLRRDVEAADHAASGETVVLTQGFIARTPKGETCLLGRGGSDTSGTLFAALIGASSCEIWTDVHGMFTTDPRQIPAARLIRRISYREAQEVAAMGAKVLHPRCLGPAAWAGIPLVIRNTLDPHAEGTRIAGDDDAEPAVMAIARRAGVTLLTISTLEMWGTSGFLARVFAPFDETGISVDLVATSQAAVSLTLDRIPGGPEGEPFAKLIDRLEALGRVSVVHPCAVVSIVGRRIRTVLHELGPALAVLQEHDVHLVSESSEDLNLSFVVDQEDAPKLAADLHSRLVPMQGADRLFGPSWKSLRDHRAAQRGELEGAHCLLRGLGTWWRERRGELLRRSEDGRPRWAYDLATVRERALHLRESLPSVGRFYYAVKANDHARILETLAETGFGFECVSEGELRHLRDVLGWQVPLLFTPNFCPVDEYARAIELRAEVTLDGAHLLDQAPAVFEGQDIAVRVDPGKGLGHHEKVRTAGSHAKFGLPADELPAFVAAARKKGARVVGLHAHVGSGILRPEAWAGILDSLLALRRDAPDLTWIDVGGGLGVVERPGQAPLDLAAVDEGLRQAAGRLEGVQIRMEPGRYLVSEAGVLLLPVTQIRSKGAVRYVGAAAGMNALIRPALYGAWHGIHNLSRLDDPNAGYVHVVGPICESGDVLGRDRLLPETRPGDVLLVENCGAYGAVMSSRYNRREQLEEWVLTEPRLPA
jgi:diaminopimelate decarboxylase/aspartate kinase